MARKRTGPPGRTKGSFRGGGFAASNLGSSFNAHGNGKTDVNSAMQAAIHHFQAGRIEPAVAIFRQVLSVQPRNADALYFLGLVCLNSGNAKGAVDLIGKALLINDRNAEFHCNLGVALCVSGQRDAGLESFRSALAVNPGHPGANYNVGLGLLEHRDFVGAITYFRKVIRRQPKNPDALMNLGLALIGLGQFKEAVAHLRRASLLAPENIPLRTNFANALIDSGAAEKGVEEFRKVLAFLPDHIPARFGLAVGLERMGKSLDSIDVYREILRIDSGHAGALANLSALLETRGKLIEAETHARLVIERQPEDVEPLLNLTKLLSRADRHEEALDSALKVLARAPHSEQAYLQIIFVLRALGRFEEARERIEELRAIDTDPAVVFNLLGEDGGYSFSDTEIDCMKVLVEKGRGPEIEISRVCFTLGGLFDRRGEFDEAFRYLKRGNRLAGSSRPYDRKAEERNRDRQISLFTQTFFEDLKGIGSQSERPVFIVGMPRSGTTLVEQIISSHPRAAGGGELPDFTCLSEELEKMAGGNSAFPECVATIDTDQARLLAGQYLETLARISPDADRVTDKMPANIDLLGLIAVLFPMARVIHCRRDPRDTCLSIFMQPLKERHSYSWSLDDLGHYYRQYERLTEHWRAVNPLRVLEVGYEDLVDAQEEKTREIIAFCGLDWDDRCLRFSESDHAAKTASFWQVRQKVYRSSLARWRNYEHHLEPLFRALNP
jgi:tetratricopeptide (TPR) repeat protein